MTKTKKEPKIIWICIDHREIELLIVTYAMGVINLRGICCN